MSKKYYDKLLTIGPSNSLPIKSSFGMNILKKFGWTEGKGLGKDEEGIKECIKVEKRPEFLGLGADNKNNADVWTNWWEGLYDNAAKNLSLNDSSFSESESTASTKKSDDFSNDTNCEIRKNLQKGKLKRIRDQNEIIAKAKKKKCGSIKVVNKEFEEFKKEEKEKVTKNQENEHEAETKKKKKKKKRL